MEAAFKKPQLLKAKNFCTDCGDKMEDGLKHECDIDIVDEDTPIIIEDNLISKKRPIPEGIQPPRIWMTDTRSHKIKPFILDFSNMTNNHNRKM